MCLEFRRVLFRSRIYDLNLQYNVLLLGAVPNGDIHHYYHACDGFLFASQSETQGIVLVETMAAGLPVVAIKASGVVNVVEDGHNGFMTEDDPHHWAAMVARLMKQQDERKRLQHEAYGTALTYSAESIAQEAETFYYEGIALHRRTIPEQTALGYAPV